MIITHLCFRSGLLNFAEMTRLSDWVALSLRGKRGSYQPNHTRASLTSGHLSERLSYGDICTRKDSETERERKSALFTAERPGTQNMP